MVLREFGQDGDMTVSTGSELRQAGSARNLGIVLDVATRSHLLAVAVLALIALASFLPGFFDIPPVDRDEARFAQATKQMIETGDYIDIRFQDEVRYKKPVGIYWLQAAAVKTGQALGIPHATTTIWLYRIPSLIGAIGAVLLTYWTALAFVPRRAAVMAGLMMATCVLLGVEARLAKTDAMLLATTIAAMGALARAYLPEQRQYLGSDWALPAVFWTAVAAGILLKGPLILMVLGLAAGSLAVADRSARWLLALRPIAGLVWCAVLVLPWFLAIMLRSGDEFFAESIGEDLFSKVVSGQESHGAPPGLYLLLFWVTFWPAATLAGLAAPAVWAARREPGARFLLAWIVPSWIVFELVVTKLPHYVLPLYPPIAILIAGIVETRVLVRAPWLTRGTVWWFMFPVITGIVGIVGLIVIGRQFGLFAWAFTGAAVVFGLFAWTLFEADGAERAMLRAAIASVLVSVTAYGLVIPALLQLFPSVTLARVLSESGCADPVAAAVGYQEPSVVFLSGTATRLTDAATAADFLNGGECRFAFVDSRQERSFAQHAESIGLSYAPGPRIEAINISMGRQITIAVYRSGAPP
jgi:4-amino-4-deoxy-L-arabinose transferase-like glycosyltransferase